VLVRVQQQLQEQTRRRCFLSIEAAGAREMRSDASEAAAAYSFGQFQDWVEELVRKAGGQRHGTVDAGLLAIFPADASAVSVARQLQEGMSRFNAERNRLSAPFRLRCGITAGLVAGDAERPEDALQSALIERAVELQRQAEPGDILVSAELVAAALLELGALAPLAREAGAAPVFSWRAGLRARQRP
jgi:class 3 adenylate cyclase